MNTIRVLVADDQRVVREGLVLVLGLLTGIEVVATAADGRQAVAEAERCAPDIVLMDLRMPGCDGVSATRQLRERHPDIKIVVLTTYADDESVIAALRAGARGYLTKDASSEEIHDALRQVAANGAAIDPAVQHHLLEALGADDPAPPGGLTAREIEVLGLIAKGLSNLDIAARLVITEATVKSHINHLLAKIGARDRAQAVGFAYQHGILCPDG